MTTGPPIYIERSFGQWRKMGYKLKAPLAADGRLMLSFRGPTGILEIDALSVRPISERPTAHAPSASSR